MSVEGSFKPFHRKVARKSREPLYRKVQMSGELGWRSALDPFANKLAYGTAGAKLRLNNFLRVGSQYRYSLRDKYKSNYSRIDLQLWLNWEKGRIRLDHRFEYEHDFIPLYKIRTVLRNRLGIEYNIPHWKLDPQLSAEAFSGMHYTGNRLVGMRYEMGTTLDIGKTNTNSLSMAIRFDQELGVADPQNRWIVVLAYAYEFKKPKK